MRLKKGDAPKSGKEPPKGLCVRTIHGARRRTPHGGISLRSFEPLFSGYEKSPHLAMEAFFSE